MDTQKPLYERRMQPVCYQKHAGVYLPESVCHKAVGSASSLRQGLQTRDRRSLSFCDTSLNTCKAKSSAQVACGECVSNSVKCCSFQAPSMPSPGSPEYPMLSV